jgi:hypothetical protein
LGRVERRRGKAAPRNEHLDEIEAALCTRDWAPGDERKVGRGVSESLSGGIE